MKAVRLENFGTKTPPGKSAEEWRRKKKKLTNTGWSSAPAESGESGGKDTGAAGTPPERRPTYSETMQGYYGDRYADALAENKTAADAAAETAERDAQDALERIRGGYKSTDRQLYREYMESKRTLPQRLAAQGITGGLTESSQVRLANSYGEELAENERARLAEEAKTYSARDARLAAARAEQSRADAEAKRTHGESLAKLWQEAEKHRREDAAKAAAAQAAEEEPPQETPEADEAPVSTAVQALGVISGTGVRMRSGAGTGYDILKTLDKGAVIELTAQEGDWYRISFDGKRGYVAAQYVTRYDTASGLNGAGRVTADVLNIRTAAKSGSTSLGTVSQGTVIAVTGIEPGGWFAVTYNGISGYVASQYVLICPTSALTGTADKPAENTTTEGSPAEAPAETPATPAVSASGSSIVSIAQQYLGVPYVYGGSSASGFDCSGFTMYVFAQAGIKLPHGATSQLSYGTEVSRSDLQPGDLVFFQDYGYTASHVGIYIGGDQFIHASSSYYNGHCVVITSLSETYYNNHYLTARRH